MAGFGSSLRVLYLPFATTPTIWMGWPGSFEVTANDVVSMEKAPCEFLVDDGDGGALCGVGEADVPARN